MQLFFATPPHTHTRTHSLSVSLSLPLSLSPSLSLSLSLSKTHTLKHIPGGIVNELIDSSSKNGLNERIDWSGLCE
jgi:hypothetical protein